MELAGQVQIDLMLKGDKNAFENIFKANYRSLHSYAFSILSDEAMADESVQEVFFKLWANRNRIVIRQSLKAYLFTSVYNQCMTHVRRQKLKSDYNSHVQNTSKEHAVIDFAHHKIELKEFQLQLQQALNKLPESCRTIFYLSRFEELKYKDIAGQLGLSVKTVEAQISKALKRLRVSLEEFM